VLFRLHRPTPRCGLSRRTARALIDAVHVSTGEGRQD